MRTLTPIWTAGADRGCDRLHETGIIGSLRWWFESVLRGLGGGVCDPTSEGDRADRCPRDDGSFCQACRLFGAGERGRAFRITVEEGRRLFAGGNILLPSGRVHRPIERAGGWFLHCDARVGDALQLRITPLHADDQTPLLTVPLVLIARHASLGAKVSSGYGVVELFAQPDGMPLSVEPALLDRLASGERRYHDVPDLRDFFFAKLTFEDPEGDPGWWQRIGGIAEAAGGQIVDRGITLRLYDCRDDKQNRQKAEAVRRQMQAIVRNGLLPTAPAVRNWLRFRWFPGLFAESGRRELEERVFGRVSRQGNVGSRIQVSHAYRVGPNQWEFRVWGWLSARLLEGQARGRDQFLEELRRALDRNEATWRQVMGAGGPICEVREWHALRSGDDDGRSYLLRLLGIGKEGGT